MSVRRAVADDAAALSRVLLRARAAAGDQFPPAVHPDDEMEPWLRSRVLPTREAWVAEDERGVVGLLVLADGDADGGPRSGEVEQLSVLPEAQGTGVGSALLRHAMWQRPAGLRLRVFVSNTRAQAFYLRQGFRTADGVSTANEEGAPDLLMRWSPGEEA